jgi:hypothetical protein
MFEYLIVLNDFINCEKEEEHLNMLGLKGWELVSIWKERMYFKRIVVV